MQDPRKDNRDSDQQEAVALQYKDLQQIPKVMASGTGSLAKEIIALAIENNVPVEKNEALVSVLSKLQPGDVITPETYELVAKLICFPYESDLDWQDSHSFLDSIIAP